VPMNVRRSTLIADGESAARLLRSFIARCPRRASEDVGEQEDQQQDAARNTE
jgi:hypothetical protein